MQLNKVIFDVFRQQMSLKIIEKSNLRRTFVYINQSILKYTINITLKINKNSGEI